MALGNNLVKQKKEVIKEVPAKSDDPVNEEEIKSKEANNEFDEEIHKINNLRQYCVFRTSTEEYAIPIDLVKEVVKSTEIAPLPHMPSYIVGMTNIRGNVYGILDIEVFFNVDSHVNHNYMLVLDHDIFKMAIAIPEVPDSIIIDKDEIENLSSSTIKSQMGQKYLKGVIKKDKRMIIVFDIEGIISSENFTISF